MLFKRALIVNLTGVSAPLRCIAARRLLLERRALYEDRSNFPPQVIDHVADFLEREDDEFLNRRLSELSAEERLHATRLLMHRDIHRH